MSDDAGLGQAEVIAAAAEPFEASNDASLPPPQRPEIQPIILPKDYVPSLQSNHELYQVHLETFNGPLDLLLFLIRRHELDIFDIPIGFICSRYLEYLNVMADLSLDVAAEFMYMASELVQIKSRMLLPKPESTDEEQEEGDPRAELVARLLEYQKYRQAAEELNSLPNLGRDVFARPKDPPPRAEGPAPLRPVSIFALANAFNEMLKKQKPEARHQVVVEVMSVKKRMMLLVERIENRPEVCFYELIGVSLAKIDLILTFLACLEMTRMKLITLWKARMARCFCAPFSKTPRRHFPQSRVPTNSSRGNAWNKTI